jgi:hypothetical protein
MVWLANAFIPLTQEVCCMTIRLKILSDRNLLRVQRQNVQCPAESPEEMKGPDPSGIERG